MDFKEYQKESARTLPDLGQKLDLCHMVLGVMTEVPEIMDSLDRVNEIEEIGDQFWYISNYCTIRNYDLNQLWYERMTVSTLGKDGDNPSVYYIGQLQDLVKKYIAYDKPINQKVEYDYLLKLLRAIDMEISSKQYTIVELMDGLDKNIKKLRIRYPDKFNNDQAINRNLKRERQILEGND